MLCEVELRPVNIRRGLPASCLSLGDEPNNSLIRLTGLCTCNLSAPIRPASGGQSLRELSTLRSVPPYGGSTRSLLHSRPRTDLAESTMSAPDIRWQQRLYNFRRALAQLDEAMALMAERPLSKLEKQGVIQGFEYCYELGWNTLKDFLVWQGIEGLVGSRDAIREGFSRGLVADGTGWMQMLADRNRTSHTYNEETAEAILRNIQQHHHPLLRALEQVLGAREEPLA